LEIASFPKCIRISAKAFEGCTKLSQLWLMASSVAIGSSSMLSNTPIALSSYLGYFGSIYVPASLLATYKDAQYWRAYSNRMVGI